ncbi:MFS transporter [Paraburkholderia sp. UYCP14C]|uniref:MFS transporter n=1 Tax=Paraburkholderia sp. UYCP14C TaxID=2511130 RepID=UPI00101F2B5B|nr:MFS transporter [Paraburkholderia sp. UYCP14C]RZF26746.1 MFS transporter [Paraburkholderia sp. UYCP14C]
MNPSQSTRAITRREIFLMALCCALAVSAIYYHQPLLPLIAATFGVAPTHGNVIATLTQLGYAAGLLLFVPLADGVQPRKLASLVIIANAVALMSCAIAPTFALLGAASFLVGATAITAQIVIPSASGMAPPASRGRVVGTLLGGLSTGVLLARTLSGLIGAHLGWRWMFGVASGVDLMLLVVVRRLPASNGLTAIRYRELMHSLVVLIREERLLRISAAMGFLTFAAFSAFWATLAALLARPPYDFGAATVGAFGLVGLLGLLLSPHIGALVDRTGARTVASVSTVLVILSMALVTPGARNLFCLLVSMVLLDLGNRAGFVANLARIYGLRPDARSRLNTVFMVSYFLGGAAGAALGGYGANQGGWVGLAIVGVVLSAMALVVGLLAHTRADSEYANGPA